MINTYVDAPLYSKDQYSEAFTARHEEILMDPNLGEEDFIERLCKIARSKFNHIVRSSKGQIPPDKAADEAFDFAEKQIESHNHSPRLLIAICAVLIMAIAGIIIACAIQK